MSKRPRIVVIEDEPDILELIAYNLRREGFDLSLVSDGAEGLSTVRRERPDLILLDLMLPELDGIEVCRRLKEASDTRTIPIVMVTARGEEDDIVRGLEVGADDYVTKPFSPRELVARVKAVLRRGRDGDEAGSEAIELEGLAIHPERHEVLVNGERVIFTATEFRLLHHLAGHRGRVYTRDQLLGLIGKEAAILDRNIDVHVRALRKKLGPHRDLIETIRGVGYRFREAAEGY